MDYTELSKEISKYSPTVSSALKSSMGALIVNALCTKFQTTPDMILTTITKDADASTKIKEFERENREAIYNIALDNCARELDDRKSTKDRRDDKYQTRNRKFEWVQHVCAMTVIFGFFIIIFTISFTKLDSSDHDILYMLMGVLGSTFSQIYQYYFGATNNNIIKK